MRQNISRCAVRKITECALQMCLLKFGHCHLVIVFATEQLKVMNWSVLLMRLSEVLEYLSCKGVSYYGVLSKTYKNFSDGTPPAPFPRLIGTFSITKGYFKSMFLNLFYP